MDEEHAAIVDLCDVRSDELKHKIDRDFDGPARQIIRPNIEDIDPRTVAHYQRYLVATAKLHRSLDAFIEIVTLHKAVCQEITRRGSTRIDDYIEDVEGWSGCLDYLLTRRPV